MRRWLCVLLLTLLPLQFSWAAVVGYCAHEADVQAPHLGHHAHAHAHADASGGGAADAAPADASDESSKSGKSGKTAAPALDLDCGHCHGMGVVVSVMPVGPPALRALRHAAPWPAGSRASHPTAPPDRPQWPALA